MKKAFSIVNLPKLRPGEDTVENSLARRLAQRFQDLRLHALSAAPEAFASAYELEVGRGLGDILDRLNASKADHFFAIDAHIGQWSIEDPSQYFAQLLDANWVGMIVLIGPLDNRRSVTASKDPLREAMDVRSSMSDHATAFHLNGMFVDTHVRRAGIGKALIEAALTKAEAQVGEKPNGFCCSIIVDSENSAARRLYEKADFEMVESETYVQQPRPRTGEMRLTNRIALKMEVRRPLSPKQCLSGSS